MENAPITGNGKLVIVRSLGVISVNGSFILYIRLLFSYLLTGKTMILLNSAQRESKRLKSRSCFATYF